MDLLKRIDQHRDISELFSLNNLALEREYTKKSENITEKEDLRGTDKDIFAECVINFFYESSSKSALSRDFEEVFFVIKVFTLILKNIPTYFSVFFRYLPSCLSVLVLIKLHFFGNYSTSKEIDDENVEDLPINSLNTCIPEKAVSLFFN